VVDNEAKKPSMGKSGIPNDCPGKFPSPWTPGTELKLDATKDNKPRSKLTAALMDARSTPQPRSVQKLKAKDDSDITLDVTAPRSESGKYWKEQYETYADKSEKEMKKLIAKQQLAKNFAKKKDGEMTEVSTRLAEERKRFRQRERELEQQNKDYQERLRQLMAENTASSVEITALKYRISVLEKSFVAPSSEVEANNFSIFEDPSKDSAPRRVDQSRISEPRTRGAMDPPSVILGRPVQSTRTRVGDKENSPLKPHRTRRQTLPNASPRPTALPSATSESLVNPAETRELSTTSQAASTRTAAPFARSTLTARSPGLPSKSLLIVRKPDVTKENLPPKSPVAIPSSPLPQGSPDPWIGTDDSHLPQIDRLTFPIASGTSSRPAKSFQSKATHRVSKSVSHVKPDTYMDPSNHTEKPVRRESKSASRRADQDFLTNGDDTVQMDVPKMAKSFIEESGFEAPKRDVVKTASALANAKDSELATKDVTKDNGKSPVAESEQDRERAERRAQAKARLAARKEKKLGT
jgi:hypothetical protein